MMQARPGRPPVTASKLQGQSEAGASVAAAPTAAPSVALPPSTPVAAPATPSKRRVEVQREAPAAAPAAEAQQPACTGAATAAGRAPTESGGGGQEQEQDKLQGEAASGDWVGQLVRGLWPFARQAEQAYAWETVPAQLEASRPDFVWELKLEQFTLGGAVPAVHDVRVHSGSGAGVDELFVELEVEWRSQQDVQLRVVVPRLPVPIAEITPYPLEDALHLATSLRLTLKDTWVRAGLRITLRPLLERLPVVGAVQVGLTRMPEFGYNLGLSKASAALVPLIKEWLDGAVRDMLFQPWVLPDHAFCPLAPRAPDIERPAGVLAVRLLGAVDVPRSGLWSGAPRPLLQLFLRDSQRHQTCVAPAGRATDWGRPCFQFPVSVPEHQELSLILYDYSEFSPNDELGRAQLPVRELLGSAGQERDVELLLRPRAEEVHEQETPRMSWGDRAAVALARPFTKKSSTPCRLRLQVSYLPLSEAEAAAIMTQQRLPATERGGGGARSAGLTPLALRLLRSGLLVVAVRRAEGVLVVAGLGLSGSLFKPFIKLTARVGRRQAEGDAARANRSGAVEFSRPLSLHLEEEDVAAADHSTVELELLAHGWASRGARSCGALRLPLGELVRGGTIEGERGLEGGAGGGGGICVQLSAAFRPYF